MEYVLTGPFTDLFTTEYVAFFQFQTCMLILIGCKFDFYGINNLFFI